MNDDELFIDGDFAQAIDAIESDNLKADIFINPEQVADIASSTGFSVEQIKSKTAKGFTSVLIGYADYDNGVGDVNADGSPIGVIISINNEDKAVDGALLVYSHKDFITLLKLFGLEGAEVPVLGVELPDYYGIGFHSDATPAPKAKLH